MSFHLSDEQALLAETARGFFAEHAPVSRLRAQRDGGLRFDRDLWRATAELGLAGMAIAEDHGGSAFGHVGVGAVMEAAGGTLAATPLVYAAILAPALLATAGRTDLLPAVASGERLYTLALDEGAHHAPDRIVTRAEPAGAGASAGAGWRLTGGKRFVPWGDVADTLIVAARTADRPDLFLVPADAPGLTLTPLHALDSRAYADAAFADTPAERLTQTGQGAALLEPALDAARAALAAEMLGIAEAAFAMTLDYLKTRRQFGQLIGSFQALQHRAALMATDLQLTRSAVRAAAIAMDTRANDVAQLCSLAKARASATVHKVTNEAIQMHGGIGMTDASDVGLYLKRARVAEAELGGHAFHVDRYATLGGF